MTVATINWDTTADDIALPITVAKNPKSIELKLRQRFRFFLGEWFLNTLEGVPYYRDILIKNPDVSVARSIFRQIILTTQDVASVRSLTIQIDRETRTMTLDFVAILADGSIFDTSLLDEPFIITV